MRRSASEVIRNLEMRVAHLERQAYLDSLTIFDELPKKKVRVRVKLSSSGGDCYEANGRYFMDNCYRDPDLRLVHGEVMGQGELQGISYGHCWCEKGNQVLDFSNGRNIKIDKKIYYLLGKIDRLNNTHVYDQKTFNENILEFQHWGPWDLKTKTGL